MIQKYVEIIQDGAHTEVIINGEKIKYVRGLAYKRESPEVMGELTITMIPDSLRIKTNTLDDIVNKEMPHDDISK